MGISVAGVLPALSKLLPQLFWIGFKSGAFYEPGDIVSYASALWMAKADTGPKWNQEDWRLVLKRHDK